MGCRHRDEEFSSAVDPAGSVFMNSQLGGQSGSSKSVQCNLILCRNCSHISAGMPCGTHQKKCSPSAPHNDNSVAIAEL